MEYINVGDVVHTPAAAFTLRSANKGSEEEDCRLANTDVNNLRFEKL